MWLNLLINYRKQILILIAMLCSFGGGMYVSQKYLKNPSVKEETKKEAIDEKKSRSTKKTVIVKEKPDGTKTTTTTEESAENTQRTSKPIPEKKAKYKLGASVIIDTKALLQGKRSELDYGINGGMRITGPLWLDLEHQIKSKKTSLGLSIEF